MTDADTLPKIQRGLDARQRLKTGLDSSTLVGLRNTPRTPSAIAEKRAQATIKAKSYREWASPMRDRLAAFAQKKFDETEKIPGITKAQRAQIVKLGIAAERERLLTESEHAGYYKDRERIRSEIVEIRRLMVATKNDWSPISLLMRSTLGSEKRRQFAVDVASAGPQELDSLLRHAISLGGEDGEALAAACFQRLDHLAETAPEVRSRVTIGKDAVASVLVGQRCIDAQRDIEVIDILSEEIGMEALEIQGGEVSQVARDALRLRKHNYKIQYPEPEPEQPKE